MVAPNTALISNPRGWDYSVQLRSWTWSYNLNLRGQDKLPTGKQSFDLPPLPRAGAAARPGREPGLDTWFWRYNLNLIGKDKFNPGQQFFDPPPATFVPQFGRQRDLNAWSWNYNLNLIGQDKLAPGAKVFDLPPRPAQRLSDYTWIEFGNSLPPLPAFPPGATLDDLPTPLAPPRREQTWTWQYNLNLVGQDRLPAGENISDRPPSAAWYRDWSQNLLQSTLAPFISLQITIAKVFDLPPRAPQQPAPSWIGQYNPNLIGQDQLPGRLLVLDNPLGAVPLPQSWAWSNPNLYPAVTPVLNITIAKLFDLPPRAPQQAAPSWTWSYNLNLLGQDALSLRHTYSIPQRPPPIVPSWQLNLLQTTLAPSVQRPFNQYDWPLPKASPRPDEAWVWSYNLNLIGQDKLPPGKSYLERSLPPGWYRDWSLNLLQSTLTPPVQPLPFNQYDWPVPRAFPRPDETWVWSYNLNLIGKDRIYGAPGQVPPYDWPNPRDYQRIFETWTAWYNLSLIGQDALSLRHTYSVPRAPAPIQQTWAFFNPNLYPAVQPQLQITITKWYDLPPRAPQQAAPSWTSSYNLNLIAQDVFPPGRVSTDLTPIGPPFGAIRSYTDTAFIPFIPPPVVVTGLPASPTPFGATINFSKAGSS